MEIHQGLSRNKIPSLAAILAILICSMGTSLAAVQDGLVGVVPGHPQIDAPGAVGQQCSYDFAAQTLTIESTAQFYFPDPNTLDPIDTGLLTLEAMIDGNGNLTGGTLTITGTTTNGGLTDPLMTGDLVALGMVDTGSNDGGDFRATPTGGSVVNGPDWPANSDITATLSLRNSIYPGSFDADWDCGSANATVGAEFFPPPVAGEIEVEIEVNPRAGSGSDCVNINGKNTVPVAILGDSVDITMINTESLIFQGLDVSICIAEDANNDNIVDLICAFEDDLDKWIPPSDGEGTLDGQLFDGTLIFGSGGFCMVSGSSAVSPVLLVLLSLIALFRRRLRVN
jgi:hypothetical protein